MGKYKGKEIKKVTVGGDDYFPTTALTPNDKYVEALERKSNAQQKKIAELQSKLKRKESTYYYQVVSARGIDDSSYACGLLLRTQFDVFTLDEEGMSDFIRDVLFYIEEPDDDDAKNELYISEPIVNKGWIDCEYSYYSEIGQLTIAIVDFQHKLDRDLALSIVSVSHVYASTR